MLEEILKVHQSGQIDEAEQRYREWLAFNPDDPEALHLLAILRRQRNDLGEALTLARKAVDLVPDRANYQLTLAGLLLHARDFDAAVQGFETALRLNPNLVGAALGLAQIALWRRDFEGAQTALGRAERIEPEHPQVQYQKANLAQARGDHERAVRLFLDLARRAPKEASLHANLAHSFVALGQTGFAEQALRNAVELKPNYVAARISLAQLLLREGRPAEAWPEFETALEHHPDHPLALAGRADLRRARGDLAGALEDYRKAHDNAPDVASITSSLILTLAASGEPDQARELLTQSLQRLPGDPELRRLQLRLHRNDAEAYLQACRDWLAAAPDNLEPAQHLAMRLELAGDYAQADEIATAALKRDSRAAFARLLLARSALRHGDPAQAQEQLNRLPEAGLSEAARVERHQLRGLSRDQLDDFAGAVDAWQANHRLQTGLARPVTPPPVESIAWPVATTDDESPEPTFLVAVPGTGAEGVVALLGHAGVRVMADRFGGQPRPDAISTGEFVELAGKAADDAEAIGVFRERYLAGLSAIDQVAESTLVDWLPFPDARHLSLIAAAFPRARWLVVERDLRDALLAWLSRGTAQAVAMPEDHAAAGAWMAQLQSHLQAALARVPSDRVLRIQASEIAEPAALAARVADFIGQSAPTVGDAADFRHTRGGLPTALPDGRWQAYSEVLADAFAPLR